MLSNQPAGGHRSPECSFDLPANPQVRQRTEMEAVEQPQGAARRTGGHDSHRMDIPCAQRKNKCPQSASQGGKAISPRKREVCLVRIATCFSRPLEPSQANAVWVNHSDTHLHEKMEYAGKASKTHKTQED